VKDVGFIVTIGIKLLTLMHYSSYISACSNNISPCRTVQWTYYNWQQRDGSLEAKQETSICEVASN